MFATKNSQIIGGVVAAAAVAMVVIIGYELSPAGSSMQTFFLALGGKCPPA